MTIQLFYFVKHCFQQDYSSFTFKSSHMETVTDPADISLTLLRSTLSTEKTNKVQTYNQRLVRLTFCCSDDFCVRVENSRFFD